MIKKSPLMEAVNSALAYSRGNQMRERITLIKDEATTTERWLGQQNDTVDTFWLFREKIKAKAVELGWTIDSGTTAIDFLFERLDKK